MKIPRDLDAKELITALRKYHYIVSRQVGSHIRLTTDFNGEHHITIPNHSPIKVGTLSAILSDIAAHINLSKEEILKELF